MMKHLLKRAALGIALAAATLVGGTSPAKADFTLTLQQLINLGDGGIIENGLRYANFSYTPTATGGAVAPTAGAINVIGEDLLGSDFLTFNMSALATTGQTLDLAINYTVEVVSGLPIISTHLGVSGGVIGTGAYVVSDNFNIPGQPALVVTNTGSSSAVLTFANAPRTGLFVNKDIFLFGGTTPGSLSTISIVTQSITRAIPEPASMAMLAIGGLGVLGAARRRNKAQA